MKRIEKNNSKGQAALIFVAGLCLAGFIILMSSLDVFTRDYNYKARDFNQVLLDETTSSTFSIMEAALERRMWEPPPDSACMKSKDFEVSGVLPNGITWNVKARYNPETKNFELTATGSYQKLTSLFKKKIKVMDASDYLLLSTSNNSIYLDRLYNQTAPAALIARDRRVYTKGPLVLGGNLDRPNPKTNWNGSPALWPAEWGTIIQGDRMQFAGGIYYRPYSVPRPNPDATSNIEALLAPYSDAFGAAQTHYSQFGGGSAVFTKDYTKAITLKDQVSAGTPGPLSKANVATEVYPTALFNGAPPLRAWTAPDSGAYFSDPDRNSIFYYAWGEDNNYGVRIDATCLSRVDAFTSNKYCSHSEHFPRAFTNWRRNADLEGYLFTSDSSEVPAPKLSWDNLEALEDDARLCGAIVNAPVAPYTDCPIWDHNFLTNYATTGSTSACIQMSSIDLDTLTLNNLNFSELDDPANKDLLLRRVIFLKVPAEIKQTNARGLMPTRVPGNVSRKNLSVWVVSDNLVSLKGYQADTTSPMTVDPDRLREVVFNKDASGAAPGTETEPMLMTILSPDKVHLLSPFYVPITPGYLTTYYPASGGKIHPVRHNITDFPRYENDAYTYGYRRYIVNNVSLIANANNNPAQPFYLQGLWSAPDSSASQFPSNQCMMSLAGQVLPPNPPSLATHSSLIPAYHSAVDSPIPPATSKFYNGKAFIPNFYVPDVFWAQRVGTNIGRDQSEVVLTGINISVDFDTFTPPGKRNLGNSFYNETEGRNHAIPVDLSHKHFTWDAGNYYKLKSPATPCLVTNMEYRTAIGTDLYEDIAANPSFNNGRQVYLQVSPSNDFRNLGAVVGVDQLVIETKNGN
ncbi:hypothetical protein [Bdellovibrio sp. HCB337]|uniref:hypothetical protein n=1 Tax=Bdellovibrio sp. HCB337 TaxID=3394358 RepID=UPI0039A71533